MGELEIDQTPAGELCKACGMCCNGHLFIWAKLRPAELDPAEALGLKVFRSDPNQRGFSQPCPLWQGLCTIYESPHYPHVCRAYKCKLLKQVMADATPLSDALAQVSQAQGLITELAILLQLAPGENFRERLVARLEFGPKTGDPVFRGKATQLLAFYEQVFGVNDLLEK